MKVGLRVVGRRKLIMWDGWLTGGWLTVVRVASHAWRLDRLGLEVGCWVGYVGRYCWVAACWTG